MAWWLLLSCTVLGCQAQAPAPESEGESGPAPGTDPAAGFRLSGTVPRATGGFPSVIELTRAGADVDGSAASDRAVRTDERKEPLLMDQYANAFHPDVLLVPRGERVSFRNSEDVLHNVRVVNRETHKTEFNVATPVVGAYEHRFETVGVYDVSCEIHPAMAAFVFVTDAVYAQVAEPRGDFTIEDVAAGVYDVAVWNLDRGRRRETRITVDRDVVLDLTAEGDTP